MKDPGRDESLGRLLERNLRSQASPSDACPDAETLAAWSDEALAARERASVEAHVADCARCQAQLAAMVRMTPSEPVLAERSALVRWRWLVPAAAAATAVALWVLVQPLPRPAPPEATAQVQAPAAQAAPATPPAATPAAEPPQARDEIARRDAPKTEAYRPSEGSGARVKAAPREQERAADSAEAPRRQEQEQDLARQRALSAAESADARRERAYSSARAAPAPLAAPAQVVVPSPLDIASPDPAVRWRVSASTIQRSTDGGATWETQPTPIDARFIAGASPSRLVCWLVGRGGGVLLSTDGRTWRRLPFPDTVDLVGVTASSASSASVTTADGRTLATSDGGITWR